MHDKIELLDINLLKDKDKLKAIDHWLKVMNWPNGWHYDLDIIWVLRHIDQLGLRRGSTIIDAGAGLGITQFILSSCGYNVISLDFADRAIPRFSKKIFNIEKVNSDLGDYTHEYMELMEYGCKKKHKAVGPREILAFLRKIADFKKLQFNLFLAGHYFKQIFNLEYLLETIKDHRDFGKITLLRGTFNNIPLPDNTADALVSVSAFEHNSYQDIPASVWEFMRVIKKSSPILLTTSAANGSDWYFKIPKAWNFSSNTLSSWFNIPHNRVSFDYQDKSSKIMASSDLSKRISWFYKYRGENALPYGDLSKAKYIPVGIVKIKEQNVF